jgi:hypothetical protein
VAKSKRQKSQNSTHAFPLNAPKVLVYDAIAVLNRDFEQVLCDLERLEGLRLSRRRWQREFLKVWRATLEETRAVCLRRRHDFRTNLPVVAVLLSE